jgi:D-cysteine desulfhydrase
LRRHDYFVPPGGSNRLGTLGYVSAMGELAQQIQRRELPCPDVIVVPVGSGGTAAGLLAGALREALPIRIIGVRVGGYAPLTRPLVLLLAARALEMFGNAAAAARLSRGLELVHDYVGRGYGFGTREAEIACSVAAGFNLELDLTYTAKAFAKALGLVGQAAIESERRTGHPLQRVGSAERPLRVLYWHTLSAVRPIASANSTSFTLPHALSDLFMRAAV